MAYTRLNFKTKKALKETVKAYHECDDHSKKFNEVRCYQPGLGPNLSNFTGTIYLEGPHYPKPHTWYAEAELVNGVVVKVK
jgi:hypothetical protein